MNEFQTTMFRAALLQHKPPSLQLPDDLWCELYELTRDCPYVCMHLTRFLYPGENPSPPSFEEVMVRLAIDLAKERARLLRMCEYMIASQPPATNRILVEPKSYERRRRTPIDFRQGV